MIFILSQFHLCPLKAPHDSPDTVALHFMNTGSVRECLAFTLPACDLSPAVRCSARGPRGGTAPGRLTFDLLITWLSLDLGRQFEGTIIASAVVLAVAAKPLWKRRLLKLDPEISCHYRFLGTFPMTAEHSLGLILHCAVQPRLISPCTHIVCPCRTNLQ